MVRFSRDRVSNKLKRASRRLRRKGYTSQAGQMAMASEQARLNEPTTYRPEHRIMEAQAADMFAESQRLASLPDFDYQRDIAPMRGQFFSDLANSGMTLSEQEGFKRRYEPQIESFDKGQAAFLGVMDAQRKMREQRKAANLAPIVAERLKPLLESGVSQEQRRTGMLDILTDNPTALNDPATANLISTFDRAYSSSSSSSTAGPRSLAMKLAEVGDTAAIKNISGLSQNEIAGLVSYSETKKKALAKTRLGEASDKRLKSIKTQAELVTKWITGQEDLTTDDLILLGLFNYSPDEANSKKADKFKRDYVKNLLLRVNGVASLEQLTEADRNLLETGSLEDLAQRLNGWVGMQEELNYRQNSTLTAPTSPKQTRRGTF